MKTMHRLITRAPRLSLTEQGAFVTRLAMYLRAGVPLLEALDILACDAGTRDRALVLSRMQSCIRDGLPLSHALGLFPGTFPKSAVGSVAAAESSGALPRALEQLSNRIAQSKSERNAILHALAYPLLLLFAATGIIGFLVIGIFPRMEPLLVAMDVPLPLVTRALMALGSFSVVGVTACIVVIISIACTALLLKANSRWSALISGFQYRIPVVGPVVRNRAIAVMSASLSGMLSSGMRLEQALSFAATESQDPQLASLCRHAQQQSLEGIPLSQSLGANTLIPTGSIALIATGERTGRLPHCLQILADTHSDTAKTQLALASRLAEPFLMTGIACTVGLVAYAILAPLYGITSRIGDL